MSDNDQELTLSSPQVQQLVSEAESTLVVAETFEKISDATMYEIAGSEIKEIKSKMKSIKETRLAITRPMDVAKKGVMDFFQRPLNLLAQAEECINRLMIDYRKEQDEIRRKKEAEARAELEKARKEAEEKAAAEAQKLRDEGKEEEAEEVEQEAVEASFTPPAVVPSTVPDVPGVHTRKNWKFRIKDANKIPREFLMPDEKKIGGVVRAMKEMANIPGVEVYCDEKMQTRTSSK